MTAALVAACLLCAARRSLFARKWQTRNAAGLIWRGRVPRRQAPGKPSISRPCRHPHSSIDEGEVLCWAERLRDQQRHVFLEI